MVPLISLLGCEHVQVEYWMTEWGLSCQSRDFYQDVSNKASPRHPIDYSQDKKHPGSLVAKYQR